MVTKTNNRMIDGSSLNIFDLGAVGDGVTDDAAAFTLAQSKVVTGGACLLPVTGTAYVLGGVTDYSTLHTYSFGVVTFDTSSGSTQPTHKNLIA